MLKVFISDGLVLAGVAVMLLYNLTMPGLAIGIGLALAGSAIGTITILRRIVAVRRTLYPAGEIVDVVMFEK